MDILLKICNNAIESRVALCEYVEKNNLQKIVARKQFNEFYIQLKDGTRLYAVPYELYNRSWCRGREYMHCGKCFRSGYPVESKESE